MRIRRASSGLTINAIAGTQVVLLGLDLGESKRPGCLGFAIQREDFTEGERYWMRGTKTFRATDPGLGPGGTISSREHPFQTFQWADYSAKPNHRYVYTVIPLYGTPEHLVEGGALSVEVMTEAEGGATHSVWFNRGAIASQEYARRFQNQAPSAIADNAAYRWLSRGLEEALLAFVARASDATFAIHGAMYEFQWPSVLAALKAASDRGAAVSILYDATPDGDGPVAKNEAAIVAADISPLCRGRANGTLMHNKFLILSHNGQPVAVWTGSTNLTENGLFGHSNLGHLIEDSAIARTYLDYWQQLQGDPTRVRMRQWLGVNNVAPPDPWDQDTTVALSPRTGMALL